jgi:putative heme-binding domain-containing protein
MERELLKRIQSASCVVAIAVCLSGLLPAQNDSENAADVDSVVTLLDLVLDADEETARRCLGILTKSLQSGELDKHRVAALREQLADRLGAIIQDAKHPLRLDAALLTTAWKDSDGTKIARGTFVSGAAPPEQRIAALQALVAVSDPAILTDATAVLADRGRGTTEFRGQLLAALGRLDQPEVAAAVLAKFDKLEPELKPRAVELLTQRPAWSRELLAAVAQKKLEKDLLNLNQLRRIASFKDDALQKHLSEVYGAIREGRDPQREQLVNRMRDFLKRTPGDPHQGQAVFKKLCAQCHKIHGEGADVGPDITLNGRNNWEQLLSNVFDPSLVVGPGYQARQLVTADGRVLTGLAAEENEQRVVLKVQGGKIETIPRDQIEAYKVSELSMMPEDLEKQLTPQEIADLMSFLALDKPPGDPAAKYLPGAPVPKKE